MNFNQDLSGMVYVDAVATPIFDPKQEERELLMLQIAQLVRDLPEKKIHFNKEKPFEKLFSELIHENKSPYKNNFEFIKEINPLPEFDKYTFDKYRNLFPSKAVEMNKHEKYL